MKEIVKITSNRELYLVEDKVIANRNKYSLCFCKRNGKDEILLFQIANEKEENATLDRTAFVLSELKRIALETENEYEKIRTDKNLRLNYDLCFPQVIETFLSHEKENRRVIVFAFKNVENPMDWIPLSNIRNKDHRRVDLRSSAWITGKLLKFLVFTHNENISINFLPGSNILLQTNEHYVLIFDWLKAQMHNSEIPYEIRQKEIASIAQAVILALGGNLKEKTIPNDGEKSYREYTAYLWRLAHGMEVNAVRAHKNFYEIVNKYWKREFYPFTTLPL